MTDTAQPDDTTGLQRTMDTLVAIRTATDLHEAVDVDALLSDDPHAPVLDIDEFADAVGRPVGRAVAHRLVDGDGTSGTVVRVASSKVVREVTAGSVRLAADRLDTDHLSTSVVELDRDRLPGPSILAHLADGDASDSQPN